MAESSTGCHSCEDWTVGHQDNPWQPGYRHLGSKKRTWGRERNSEKPGLQDYRDRIQNVQTGGRKGKEGPKDEWSSKTESQRRKQQPWVSFTGAKTYISWTWMKEWTVATGMDSCLHWLLMVGHSNLWWSWQDLPRQALPRRQRHAKTHRFLRDKAKTVALTAVRKKRQFSWNGTRIFLPRICTRDSREMQEV